MRTPEQILRDSRTIALVGASPKPDRPSNGVMRYLLEQGYRVIPVRPLDYEEVHGVPCVASLADIDEPIDLVDVFRRVDAARSTRGSGRPGAKAFWLQLDLRSRRHADLHVRGLDYVEDECTAIVHRRL